MNSYDYIANSPLSGKLSNQGGSLLNNMKALIVHQDQKIQEKLKALNELKDTMTYQNINHNFKTNDSFNNTKLLGRHKEEDFEYEDKKILVPKLKLQERQNQYNSYCQQNDFSNQSNHINEDQELRKLREKYLDRDTLQKYNEISEQQYDSRHNRNKSNYDMNQPMNIITDKNSQRSYFTQLNKSQDNIGSRHQRRDSTSNNIYSSDRRGTLNKLFHNQYKQQTPNSQYQIDSNLDQRDTCNTEGDWDRTQQVTQIREEKILDSSKDQRAHLRFPQFNVDRMNQPIEISQTKQNIYKMEQTPQNEILQHQTDRTNFTYKSDTTITNNKNINQNPKPITLPPKIISQPIVIQSPPKLNDISQITNIDFNNDLSAIKQVQREQSQMMSKLYNKLDKQDVEIAQQISKSVERITQDLQILKQQLVEQKQEEDQRYQKLTKDVKFIKHYYKKRKQRHSKKQLQEQTENRENYHQSNLTQFQSDTTASQMQSKYLTHTNSEIHQVQQLYPYNQPQILQQAEHYNSISRTYSQDLCMKSANFGVQSKIDTTASLQKFKDIEKQISEQNTYYQNQTQMKNNEIDQRRKINQNNIYLHEYDYPQQTQPQNTSNVQHLNSYQSHHQQNIHNLSQKHTISFNTEIEKVREESQKNIRDLKSFYETQLQQMREEFQHREIILKDKMKVQIQESMNQERDKLSHQLQQLEKEKQSLQDKLTNPTRSHNHTAINISGIHSKTQSRTSFVSDKFNQDLNRQNYKPLDEITNNYQTLSQVPHLPVKIQTEPEKCQLRQSIQEKKKQPRKSGDSLRKNSRKGHHKDNSMIITPHNLNNSLRFEGDQKFMNNTQSLNQTHLGIIQQQSYHRDSNPNTSHKITNKKRSTHHEKYASIGNMQQMNQFLATYQKGLSTGKENYNSSQATRQIISEKDDKLYMKEKEILNRINKIENFLKRP